MNKTEQGRLSLWLSFPIALLLTGTSLGGLFLPYTYSAETRLQAVQYAGNDAGNLFLIVPFLTFVAIMALRGSAAGRLVWMGTLVYLVYDFLGYAFAVHFNAMFLAYCAVLGLSFFVLEESFLSMPLQEVTRCCGPRTPTKIIATVLLVMGLGIVLHWMSAIIPAEFAGRAPQTVRESGLVTETTAVLDLAFGAPACLIVAILLFRHKPLGIVLGPIMLTFLGLSGLVLAPMGIAMARRGFVTGGGLCFIGLGIATGSTVLLAYCFRKDKAVSGGGA